MKKIDFKLILAFIAVLICIGMMIVLVNLTKERMKTVDSNPSSQRIIIVDRQTNDTIINRRLDSFTPKELDGLTKLLNER